MDEYTVKPQHNLESAELFGKDASKYIYDESLSNEFEPSISAQFVRSKGYLRTRNSQRL